MQLLKRCSSLVAFSCAVLFFSGASRAAAEVQLPRVFSDHMVLQQGKPIPVWGWAAPGEEITVRLQEHTVNTRANSKGEWKAVLPPMKVGGPFELAVTGSHTITFTDVLIGEVWLCSGQSNMEMGISLCEGADTEIPSADFPHIRLLSLPNRWSQLPETNIETTWKVCSPKTLKEDGWGGFPACGYYFGKKLHQELDVPIGLIDATWGGTQIQSWTPPEGFAAVPTLKGEYERVLLGDPRTAQHQKRLESLLSETEEWVLQSRKALSQGMPAPTMPSFPGELSPPHDLQQATALYNGMINPLCPFALAGAIWYQGEANLNDGMVYCDRMKALIQGWRQIWGEAELPFDFVQIAPYNYGGRPEAEPELWEAQSAAAASVPNVGMAVVNDIGNLRDIHPKNKREVGRRLALIALAKTYGRNNLEYSGPVFRDLSIVDGKLRVKFAHAEGLTTRDGKAPDWFDVIDAAHGGFVKADATIEGDSVSLSSSEAPHPVAMRFAWSMLAEPNLMNNAGLPASAFRAGKVPERDSVDMTVPEAKDYKLVYDLDLAKLAHQVVYTQDHSSQILQPFSRIAYFLELQPANGQPQYLYVSMKPFTSDVKKIGVPTSQSGAHFQCNVKEMDVFSNVDGIRNGTHLSGGNIEFWSSNYGPDNSAKVPGASSDTFDFGDSPAGPADGYGSMQVHNHDARQTLFALNHWSEGEGADLGIGNQPKGNPDWTFAHNANSYVSKRLRVLVFCK